MAFPYKILNDMSAKFKKSKQRMPVLELAAIRPDVEYHQSPSPCPVVANRSNQTLPVSVLHQAVQTEPADFALRSEVDRLKKMVIDLTYENNRYHYKLSNCTCCLSDDACHDVSLTVCDESIRASTPLDFNLSSSTPSYSPSSVPAPVPMPNTTRDRKRKVEIIKKGKDQTYITKMVKTLAKLEKKYQTPEHKRKPRLFKRKKMRCSIVPKELSSIYEHLATPGPDETTTPPMLIPQVNWHNVKFKPVLPSPEECAVYSCAADPEFYKEKTDSFHIRYNMFHKKHPFVWFSARVQDYSWNRACSYRANRWIRVLHRAKKVDFACYFSQINWKR